jgi:hypothetical protein
MITVIIPTFRRPDLLRTALASVARQSRLDLVTRVVVSENGGCRLSEAICREFPEVPVEYVFQDPLLSTSEHAQQLMTQFVGDSFTAVLHDDDWWRDEHLAWAVRGFESYPDAVMYAAAYYHVQDERSLITHAGSPCCWFGMEYAPLSDFWLLNREAVFQAALLHTPVVFSSTVVRSEPLRRAGGIFELGNPYDVDRMLLARLAASGPLIFRPYPETFRRHHAGQDVRRFTADQATLQMSITTRWILSEWGPDPQVLTEGLNRRLTACPPSAHSRLAEDLFAPWCLPTLGETLSGIRVGKNWGNPYSTAGRLAARLSRVVPWRVRSFFGGG